MLAKTRTVAAATAVCFACLLGMSGEVLTFVPGAEARWFAFAAGVASCGLLAPTWRMRLLALALAAGLGGQSILARYLGS